MNIDKVKNVLNSKLDYFYSLDQLLTLTGLSKESLFQTLKELENQNLIVKAEEPETGMMFFRSRGEK